MSDPDEISVQVTEGGEPVEDAVVAALRQEDAVDLSQAQATELDAILAFGGVAPEYATVIEDSEWRMDFRLVLSGATTFQIDWLSVEFEPDGGGN